MIWKTSLLLASLLTAQPEPVICTPGGHAADQRLQCCTSVDGRQCCSGKLEGGQPAGCNCASSG